MLVRRQAFEQLKGFDSGFFMYWEDVDLCKRARHSRWQVQYDPSIKVSHLRGVSLGSAAKKTQIYDTSADRYFHKHYPLYIWGIQHFGRNIYRFFYPRVS